MTDPNLAELIEQYRVGLDAELALLGRLQEVAAHQHATSLANDIEALERAADEREALMSGLVGIEQEMRGIREQLSAARQHVRRLPGFAHVAGLHKKVTGIVQQILDTDRDSIRALERVVLARRVSAHALEQGESALTAYGQLIAPPAATLVNRRG